VLKFVKRLQIYNLIYHLQHFYKLMFVFTF